MIRRRREHLRHLALHQWLVGLGIGSCEDNRVSMDQSSNAVVEFEEYSQVKHTMISEQDGLSFRFSNADVEFEEHSHCKSHIRKHVDIKQIDEPILYSASCLP
jgi:hypothetical protein